MTIDTSDEKKAAHDHQAAGLYGAMAARAFCRFVDFRSTAEHYGAELPGYGEATDSRGAREHYKRAVDEWAGEPPTTACAAMALVEFAASISADKLMSEIAREGAPVNDETDALHQIVALSGAAGWINEHANAEYLDRIRQQAATAERGRP